MDVIKELIERKSRLENENRQLKAALWFYAEGRHLWNADERERTSKEEWDSVSGVVENGGYAREVLWSFENENFV